ncbi:MAG: peptidase M48, partial [Sideroxydans sp. RIFOXYB12_FULL_59_6]
MLPSQFSAVFVSLLLTNVVVKAWLAWRQLDHVSSHRAEVPPAFREQISIAAHHKAADYTRTLVRFGLLGVLFDAALLLVFTLGGGIQTLHDLIAPLFDSLLLQGALLIVSVLMIQSLLETPLDLYRTFNIEARFGFNKMTLKLYLSDMLKQLLLGAALGLPLLFAVLWLVGGMGDNWWLYVWGVWVVFNLFLLFIYPSYIAPLFNKFEPLTDEESKARIEALLQRCGFSASGLFVMDGSKRSTHGNAYFTGFGKTKRIVFFDTLLQRLTPGEMDAVLAHELGHFKRRHVLQRIVATFAISLAFLWGLAQLMQAE